MTICVITLGCPKNIVDSEYLTARLFDKHVQFVDRADEAEVVIINTCAFILPAREEAIETILEAIQLKTEGKIKRIYVTGCLPQRYLEDLQKELPEVDGFFNEYDFNKIGRILAHKLRLNTEHFHSRRLIQTPNHYAYLKIAEGCDNRCRYCTIPQIKGDYRDRSVQELIDEAKELANNGVRELILVAQDTTYYGFKSGKRGLLCQLIRSLVKIEAIKWIRVLYAYPTHVEKCLLDLYAEQEKLCHYIDLPIQHISDKILKSMGRHTTSDVIKKLIDALRKSISDIAIRTTLMVGFPGEEEHDFELLKQFVIATEFERLGVFKYSVEDGTYAAQLPNHVDEKTKQDRYEVMMEIQAEISKNKNEQLLGQTLPVIIDERDESNSTFLGRTQWDSPLIDNNVRVTGDLKIGNIYPIKIDRAAEYELWGENKSSRK